MAEQTDFIRPFRVLFVDNSRTIRAAMSQILSQAGYNVVAAASGPEAIELLQQESFDLAIMDLFMPEMNGYEAARIIRKLTTPTCHIPIIALTASQDERNITICKESGMNEYVIKSPDHGDLLAVIQRYRGTLH